MNCWRYNFNNY